VLLFIQRYIFCRLSKNKFTFLVFRIFQCHCISMSKLLDKDFTLCPLNKPTAATSSLLSKPCLSNVALSYGGVMSTQPSTPPCSVLDPLLFCSFLCGGFRLLCPDVGLSSSCALLRPLCSGRSVSVCGAMLLLPSS
jgi:hypothetical protein